MRVVNLYAIFDAAFLAIGGALVAWGTGQPLTGLGAFALAFGVYHDHH